MTANPFPHNLPAALSSFIGRDREIAEVKRLLAANRLVALTGQGGSGKTRLALQVAGELLAEVDDGVWLTEFAPLADPAIVPQSVASSLGLREQPGRSLTETLIDHLRPRRVLLVFDNCEHLVAACAQLADALLRACPALRLLATSREPLGVPGEATWVVPSLSLPEPVPWRSPASGPASLSTYQQSEAMRLFVDRAMAAAPAFRLTEQNAAWAADICRRLDGMPLAIELAAARVRAISVEQIAERLDDRFRLLTGGNRTAPLRQQTLAATLDWSYALLSGAEQTTLQRLSVFAGGWTLPAAEAVCAGEGLVLGEVLDLLAHLVDKSLVVADKQGGEMRYGMLETIREYARERLLESGQASLIRRRHAEYYLALAQQAARTDTRLYWPEKITTINRLEVEHDNLRAAHAWSQTEPDGQALGLRLATALAQFWQMRGYVSEGLAWLQTFLSKHSSAPAARAEALFLAGYLYMYTDHVERGAPFFEQALALFRELGDSGGIAWQLVWLGWVAVAQGDYPQVATLAEPAFVTLRDLGDLYGAAVALFPRGEAAFLQGHLAQAAEFYEESLALMRAVGNPWSGGRRLTRLGQIAHRQGDPERGLALIREATAACLEGGDNSGVAMALAATAGMARADGAPEKAVRLLGAVAALQETTGAPLWFVDRVDYQRNVAAMRAEVGETGFAEQWAAGQALTLPQAIQLALEPSPASHLPARQAASTADWGGLTEREREVAALIAQGKSNRQIAEAMVVGVRTVETYVTRILSKLDFDSRVQIATWAIDKGLSAPSPAPDA